MQVNMVKGVRNAKKVAHTIAETVCGTKCVRNDTRIHN